MQLRHASLRVGLFDTAARHVTTTRDDEVGETLLGVCGQSEVEITPWLRAIVGLRADPMRSRIDALSLAARQRLPSPAHAALKRPLTQVGRP